jgi:hypothetical protein
MFDPVTIARLEKACEREFDIFADHLFKQMRMYSATTRMQIPLIGGAYFVDAECSKQKELVVDALRCQYLFYLVAPDWAPRLPLHPKAARTMAHDPDPRLRMVGTFSLYLHEHGWHLSDVYDYAICVRDLEDPKTLDKYREAPWLDAVLAAFAVRPKSPTVPACSSGQPEVSGFFSEQ